MLVQRVFAGTNATTAVTEIPLTEPQLEIMLAAQVSDEANCAFNESFRLNLEGALRSGCAETCMAISARSARCIADVPGASGR